MQLLKAMQVLDKETQASMLEVLAGMSKDQKEQVSVMRLIYSH
jgi:hypothetical protein